MMSHSIVVLWMDGMWSMFQGYFVLEFAATFNFCCMTEVKVMMGKDVRVGVQFLGYPSLPLFKKWGISKIKFEVCAHITLLLTFVTSSMLLT